MRSGVEGCYEEHEVLAFVDGTLSSEACERVEEHVDRCAACRELVVFAARMNDGARTPSFGDDRSAEPIAETIAGGELASEHPGTAGRYVVLQKLGAGGMGSVYAAYDPKLGRTLALKFLLPSTSSAEAAFRARVLRREARVLARLRHPNIVEVYDIGSVAGRRPFVAMQMLDGVNLLEWILAASPEFDARFDMLLQAGRGLAAAHAVHVLHCDFKPSNVMITRSHRAVVVDFGLGVRLDDAALTRPPSAPSGERMPLEGSSVPAGSGPRGGTPLYMAPEQHRGCPLDVSADQFAFCASAWRVLGGRDAFEVSAALPRAQKESALLQRKLEHALTRCPTLPPALADVLAQGMDPDPKRRHASMDALLEALVRARRPSWRRPTLAAVMAASGLLAWALPGAAVDECAARNARAAQRWTGADREALHAAFMAGAPEYADDAWRSAAARLDGVVARWTEQHERACALRSTGDVRRFDLAMQCLRRTDARLEATLEQLRVPSARSIEHATALIEAIPSPQRCLDPLDSVVPPMSQMRGRALAVLQVAVDVGEEAEAIDPLERFVDEARSHGDARAVVEGLLLLGTARRQRSDLDGALAAFEDAAWRALTLDANALVVDAATRAARGAMEQGTADDAQAWLQLARAAARRHGPDPRVAAVLEAGESVLAEYLGHPSVAIEHARRALASRREAVGSDSVEVLDDRLRLTFALIAGEEIDDAIEEARRAHRLSVELLGRSHPKTIEALAARSMTLEVAGDLVGALGPGQEALELSRRVRGEVHRQTAKLYRDVGSIFMQRGELDQAQSHFTRALESYRALYGEHHVGVGAALGSLALLFEYQGRDEEALAHNDAALEVLTAVRGPQSDLVGKTHGYRASILIRMGRGDEAEASARLAVDILRRTQGSASTQTAKSVSILGKILAARGDTVGAEAAMREAVGTYVAALGEAHPRAAHMRIVYGRFLLDHGDTEAGIAQAERALESLSSADVDPVYAADALFTEAIGYFLLEEHRRAYALARQALELYRSRPGLGQELAAGAETWMHERGFTGLE